MKLEDLAVLLERTANMMRNQTAVFEEYGMKELGEGQAKIADQIETAAANIRAGKYNEKEQNGDSV